MQPSCIESKVGFPPEMFSFGIVCIYAVVKQMVFVYEEAELQDGKVALDVIVLRRQISYFAEREALEAFFDHIGEPSWAELILIPLDTFNDE